MVPGANFSTLGSGPQWGHEVSVMKLKFINVEDHQIKASLGKGDVRSEQNPE